ncbi:MAG: DUF4340 domain-containing protein [Proteobacteria bacterium]|nr:DUF4340 domain-containing protein [Pseudomonadota bacterium]
MNTRVGLLAVVLGVQMLLVVAVLAMVDGDRAPSGTIVGFDPASVTSMVLTGGEDADNKSTVSLTRKEAGWELDDTLPADGDKIREVLDKLAGFKSPWPVATSSEGARRFEVNESNFQRRVVIGSQQGVVADLFFGTSPGYRRVHARSATDSNIYSVDFSNYELPLSVDEWLLKTLLQADGAITAIKRDDVWTLERSDAGWLVNSEAAGQEQADRLVERFTNLRVTGISENTGELKAVFTVTDAQGALELSVYHDAEADSYNLSSDRRAGRYAVPTYIAEQMIIDVDDLKAAKPQEGAPLPQIGQDSPVPIVEIPGASIPRETQPDASTR